MQAIFGGLVGKELVDAIVENPFAWPGGYATGLVMQDGGVVCSACVIAEQHLIRDADVYDGQWHAVAAYYVDADDDLDDTPTMCSHCGRLASHATTQTSEGLPSNPSDLIELAVRDIEACEKDPHYIIKMDFWHHPTDNGDWCYICLGGAVLAQSLKCDRQKLVDVHYDMDPDDEVTQKLLALDHFRTGRVQAGLEKMGLSSRLGDRRIDPYYSDGDGFKADLLELAKDLREVGL